MSDFDFRYKLLEQKVEVMQKEVSQVLQEMQTTIQAIAATYSTALKVIIERVDAVEKIVKVNEEGADKIGIGGQKDETTSIEL